MFNFTIRSREYFNGQFMSTLNAFNLDEQNVLLQGVSILFSLKIQAFLRKYTKIIQEKEKFKQYMKLMDENSDAYLIMKLWLAQIDEIIENAPAASVAFSIFNNNYVQNISIYKAST